MKMQHPRGVEAETRDNHAISRHRSTPRDREEVQAACPKGPPDYENHRVNPARLCTRGGARCVLGRETAPVHRDLLFPR